KGQGLLFRKGEVVRKVPQEELADALVDEARRLIERE
ncbi:MAG: flavodoxin-dependent (E)-4-hydroxy-3-methylbut-2-enyl-diphosphate synthase, partial [Desulfuromonadales bacterium]|nr:flavodoxin-dependent (E)-4-hydroxy-3-methylbut-2-enyl-diphosphate synthase [Desulfuromonadales bacterium]NIS40663.1 flavodoxin-dependent (E)-4-hydroxy-3-methylbut-2-enyl-diphosphate synthase [Desulfuromonadales bacterium]